MRNSAPPNRKFFLSPRPRTLLMAALLALGPGVIPAVAQFDLAGIRARAQAGDADALNTLGNLAANGQGVPQNDAEALRYYTQAAERGHAPANFNLGMMSELGRGTPRDLKAAFAFYLKAAESGFAPAQFNVGNMYANGIGTAQDYFEAAIWFRQAAEKNVPEAQYNLGLAYELGRGLTKDESLAVKWYRSASEQGYARARYNLALMLEEGRGAAVDETSSAQLYRAAAEQGFGPAQNNYGIMLAEGRGGLVPNLVDAYVWLALAAENGVNATGRDLVAGRLSPEQLGAARDRLMTVKAQLSGRPAPAAPAAVPEAAAPPSAALAARLKAAESEAEKLRGDNARLASLLQDLRQEKGSLEQRLDQLTKTAQAAQAPSADQSKLQAERNSLQSANAALSDQLAQVRADLKKSADAAARLETENARLRQRPAADPAASGLREQLDKLTREAAGLRDDKEKLAAQNQDLAAQLQAARSAPAQPVDTSGTESERIARLTADNQRLNDEVKRATIELGSLTRKLRRVETKSGPVGDAPAGTDADAAKLADLQRQLDEAQANVRRLTEQNQQLAARPVADPATVEKLAATEQELAGAKTELQAQTSTLEQVRGALAESERKLNAAQTAPAQPSANERKLAADLATVQSKLDETTAQLVDARRETEELRVAAQSAQGKSSVEANRLQTQLNEANRTLESVRAENASLEQRLAAAGQDRKQAANDELKQVVADLAATRARLAEAQQAADNTIELARAREAENAALHTQVESLKGDVAALQNRPAAPADGGQVVADLKAQLDAATAAAATARDEATRAQREQQRLADVNAGARTALQQAQAEGAQWQMQADGLKADVARLSAENRRLAAAPALAPAKPDDQLTAQLDAAAQTLEAKDKRIAELGAQITSLQQDLEVAKQAADAALAAQATAARAVPAASAMQLEMQTLQNQVKTLEAQIQGDQKNAAEEFARLANQLQLAREANRALAEANRALLNSKNAESATVNSETEQLNARIKELTASGDKLVQERNALRTQLDDAGAKLADAERRFGQFKQEADAFRTQAQADIAALQAKLSESDHATDRQGANVAELTGLNDRLTRDKTALEAQVAQLKQQADRGVAEVAQLKDRIAANERLGDIQKANVNDLATANEQLQAQVKMLTEQVATLKSDNAKLGEQGDTVASLRRDLATATAANDQLSAEIARLRRDSAQLAQTEQARQDAEARAASLGTVSNQLSNAQRDLAALRAENVRLNDTLQTLERDRSGRISALQQENAAISARLRQAQGTLDQIAAAARLMNPGAGGTVTPVRPVNVEPIQAQPAAPQVRTHIVVDGDSLSRISLRYYGTPNRWQEIYDANRDTLAGANALRPGQPLRIP